MSTPVPATLLARLLRHARLAKRRHLLLAAGALLTMPFPRFRSATAAERTAPKTVEAVAPTLAAFLDTLIPADEYSPAASAIGLAERLMAEAEADPNYNKLILVVCRWIDAQTDGGFVAAPERARDLVVGWMAKAATDTPQRRFFDLVRDHALTLYYAHPDSWRGLAFDHPPQPIGYPEVGT